MKYIYTLITTLLISSCSSQVENDKLEFIKHINENTPIIEFEGQEYKSTLHYNTEDTILIYQSPMESLVGKRYTKSRNQYKVMPIINLHPKGIFFDSKRKLIKIYPRENKPGFFDNISSNNRLRWANDEYDSDVCTIRMNENYGITEFNELSRLYGDFIKSENRQINPEEEPPKEGVKRPKFKNYRNRTLNLKSELEDTDLVLPTRTVTTKPTINNLNFQESLRFFESEMKNSLIQENASIQGNLRGYILIDKNGQIIEVLQEESGLNYSKKSKLFEEVALRYNGWKPAQLKGKPVICKVKYYIQKKDWD